MVPFPPECFCCPRWSLLGYGPVGGEKVCLGCGPGDAGAVYCTHVDVGAVGDAGSLGVDAEEGFPVHGETGAVDEVEEHAFAVPSGAGDGFPGTECGECCPEVH